MTTKEYDQLLQDIQLTGEPGGIQYIQTEHRIKLIQKWNTIVPGQCLLEIGCGQGDTSSALATAVGPAGKIIGVDAAQPTYGSPLNLGQATQKIKGSSLGQRVDFFFNVDISRDDVDLDFLSQYPQIDGIVISHTSYYFSSVTTLQTILSKLITRFKIKTLYFAEWDHTLHNSTQLSHYLAVSTLAKYALIVPDTSHNVRTIYTRDLVKDTIQSQLNGNIIIDETFSNPALHDAKWEIQYTTSNVFKNTVLQSTNKEQQHYLLHEAETIRQLTKMQQDNKTIVEPLNIFVLVATFDHP